MKMIRDRGGKSGLMFDQQVKEAWVWPVDKIMIWLETFVLG